MQLELFKAEQVNVYKDIESIDIAEIVDPTTGELVLKNVKKDAYYLYKTGCPHKILKDEGDIFPGVYSKVSGKFLKLHFENQYLKFTVDSKDKKTNLRKKVNFHRLVASAFIVNDDPKTKKVVDHINELKFDYRLENLRWLSQSENSKRGNLKKAK